MAKVIPLLEGSFTVDKSKEFAPFDTEKDDLQQRSRGSLLVEVQPFLLKIRDELILFDTGLGFETQTGTLQLHHNLKQNGITPEQVDRVLMSHLHKDHTGGISQFDAYGDRELSFPNANYYICQSELNYAFENIGSSYVKEQLDVLIDHPQVKFFDGNGSIDSFIEHEHTGGHCPYHQVFKLSDEEGIYFFGGDVAPQYSQLKRRFMAKYDDDGRKSMELRQRYLEQGKEEGWTFMFYHDVKTPYVRL